MMAEMETRYADTENRVLARELGVSVRTVERWAAKLGLRKSEAFRRRVQAEAVKGAVRWVEWMQLTGQKIRKSPGGKPFEKGHRFEEAIEKKRIKAIRDRAWDERVRMMHGWRRKTRWNMVNDYKCGTDIASESGNSKK